jgi:hypothetical protein
VTEHWVPIGSPDKLTPGDFTSVVYAFRLKAAWREVKKEGLIYVRSAKSLDLVPRTGLIYYTAACPTGVTD